MISTCRVIRMDVRSRLLHLRSIDKTRRGNSVAGMGIDRLNAMAEKIEVKLRMFLYVDMHEETKCPFRPGLRPGAPKTSQPVQGISVTSVMSLLGLKSI